MGHILKYIYLEPEAYYDLIAGEYDSRTATKMCRAENEVLFEELLGSLRGGTILDAGCGTGLALDYCDFYKGSYSGFDISDRMLRVAIDKHPEYRDHLVKHSLLDIRQGWFESFDNIWCLFGSISCLGKSDIEKAFVILRSYLKRTGRMVLMPNGTKDPRNRKDSCHFAKGEEMVRSSYTLLTLSEWKEFLDGQEGMTYRIRGFNTDADRHGNWYEPKWWVKTYLHNDLGKDLTNVSGHADCSFFIIEVDQTDEARGNSRRNQA